MVARFTMALLLTMSLVSIFLFLSTIIEGRLLLTVTLTHDDSSSVLPQITKEENEMKLRGREIGSRPPKCEGRCKSCGHCEAIQVPTIPVTVSKIEYKPITWKCKCGTSLFNP
ncbi:EPIDERMAL PATTERNING FACTOR-like protein 2 isoform X2 [Spinacia oleracea]|uniref:Epidermal patterning factor-like protein n=1 Tax=Spinacia oleracea TaxID=3562 RepID=A0A9R0JYR1_SPIOL|nr:EPIDERMAL PATTERNING FACTOR-like protein 2 isoform X2 [Spinacia oleracea]